MIKNLLILILLYLIMPTSSAGYSDVSISKITGTTVEIGVPMTFEEGDAAKWKSIEYFLVHSKYKNYIFKWRGFGGLVSEGKIFISYIQEAQSQGKYIIIKEVGNSYSMHSLVLCYADKLINSDNYFRMFHAEGHIDGGKDTRRTKQSTEMSPEFNTCVSRGLISSAQLDKLWQGFEVYINNNNVWYFKDLRKPEQE